MRLARSAIFAVRFGTCFALGAASATLAQESVADYDHSDPAVRADFLEYLGELANKGEIQRYIEIAAELVTQWQAPEQNPDLRKVCRLLFGMSQHVRIRGDFEELVAGCPQDLRDTWSGKVDREAIATIKVAPRFSPSDIFGASDETVIVSYAIDETGQPTNVQIVRSTARKLNRAILRAAKYAKFLPAILEGKPAVTPIYYSKYEVTFHSGGANTVISDIGTSLDEVDDAGDKPSPEPDDANN